MTLHLNYQEQIVSIEKLFKDYPYIIRWSSTKGIVFLQMDDLLAAHYYANIVSMSGWVVTVLRNSFCDKAILQVYLHRN